AWQVMAAVPEAEVRQLAAERTDAHEELTSAEVYARGNALRDAATVDQRLLNYLRHHRPDLAAAVDGGTQTLDAAEQDFYRGLGQEAAAYLRAHHPTVADAVAAGELTVAQAVIGDGRGGWALTT